MDEPLKDLACLQHAQCLLLGWFTGFMKRLAVADS